MRFGIANTSKGGQYGGHPAVETSYLNDLPGGQSGDRVFGPQTAPSSNAAAGSPRNRHVRVCSCHVYARHRGHLRSVAVTQGENTPATRAQLASTGVVYGVPDPGVTGWPLPGVSA